MYEGSGRYRHYKGGEYLVIGKAIREESKEGRPHEDVIYKPLSNSGTTLVGVDFWSRTLEDFNAKVWLGEGEDATEVPRFKMIGGRAV